MKKTKKVNHEYVRVDAIYLANSLLDVFTEKEGLISNEGVYDLIRASNEFLEKKDRKEFESYVGFVLGLTHEEIKKAEKDSKKDRI